jgi:hypothetical protein
MSEIGVHVRGEDDVQYKEVITMTPMMMTVIQFLIKRVTMRIIIMTTVAREREG